MAYTGETRGKKTLAKCQKARLRLLVQRGRVEKADLSQWAGYAYDNSVFSDFKAGRDFDAAAFLADVLVLADRDAMDGPDFAVLPDIVAGGLDSLALSLSWLHLFEWLDIRLPWALAVQNGMSPEDIPWSENFDVIFVGGSTDWKLATAKQWADAAHAHGRTCHVGRMGSGIRVQWAKACGVDSIDSSLPLFSDDKLSVFVDALGAPAQLGLGDLVPPPRVRPLTGGAATGFRRTKPATAIEGGAA